MTWLTPIIAGIAAVIAVPSLLLLYFLKLRRQEVEISTTLLWQKAIEDLQANAPFQRLRRNLLLLLQLLVLTAILLAIAQPQLADMAVGGTRHVILIDRSASMSSLDARAASGTAATRLEQAKRDAIEFVESLPEPGLFSIDSGDEVMVIAFDASAEVRANFTGDKAVLRQAINAIAPTDGPSLLAEAYTLAKAHARPAPRRDDESAAADAGANIRIYTDGRIQDIEEVSPAPEDRVSFERIGDPESSNVAIVAIQAERSYDDPLELSVYVGIQNTDSLARDVDVELYLDGRNLGIKSVRLPAAGVGDDGAPGMSGVSFTVSQPEGGLVSATVRHPGGGFAPLHDVLDSDNTAHLVIPPARRLSVALVTEGDLFLENGLEALPLSRYDVIEPSAWRSAVEQRGVGAWDVVVFDRWAPKDEAHMPSRALMFGAIPPSPEGVAEEGSEVYPGLTPTGTTQNAFMLNWDRGHPVTGPLLLDRVAVQTMQTFDVEAGSGVRVLATTTAGPGLIELSSARLRALVVTFGAADSTWPWDVSFPVFLPAALTYLGTEGAGQGRLVKPGETLVDRLPRGAREVRVQPPTERDGSRPPAFSLMPAADGRIAYGPITRAGVYEISWEGPAGPTDVVAGGDGRSSRRFAANLLSPQESDVTPTTSLETASKAVSAASDVGPRAPRRLWPWLIGVALGVMLLEWWIYNRKVYL